MARKYEQMRVSAEFKALLDAVKRENATQYGRRKPSYVVLTQQVARSLDMSIFMRKPKK